MGHFLAGKSPLFCFLFCVIAAAGGWAASSAWHDSNKAGTQTRALVSASPGMDYLDNFKCPRGQTRWVQIHGREDNFSRAGEERASIRPALLDITFYRELAEDRHAIFGHRDYDEGGADKFLIDSFAIPRGVLSGKLVTRLKPAVDNRNDSLALGDLDIARNGPGNRAPEIQFGGAMVDPDNGKLLADTDGLTIIDLETLHSGEDVQADDFFEFANRLSRPGAIDLNIQDDTIADFAALALCLEPDERRGTTFTEHVSENLGPDLSYMSCALDFMLPSCNPFRGDHLCSAPSAIACYKDGTRPTPSGLSSKKPLPEGSFVGGEVRFSKPAIPDRFATLKQANAYCAAQYGAGWRVLSYHEAAGSQVASYSKIAPGSRAMVHVADREYGNCWDRPESVIRP